MEDYPTLAQESATLGFIVAGGASVKTAQDLARHWKDGLRQSLIRAARDTCGPLVSEMAQ